MAGSARAVEREPRIRPKYTRPFSSREVGSGSGNETMVHQTVSRVCRYGLGTRLVHIYTHGARYFLRLFRARFRVVTSHVRAGAGYGGIWPDNIKASLGIATVYYYLLA